MSMNFLRADGSADEGAGTATPNGPFWLPPSVWLPSMRQISDALQFQIGDAVGPEHHEDEQLVLGRHTTMQQGLGLVVAAGVIAGSLPFVVNLVRAASSGTSLQMLSIAEFAMQRTRLWTMLGLDPQVMGDTFQQIAGMSPRVPGFLAAILSALGGWVNTPLTFLSLWIAYGAGVLALAHLVGAKATLQRFFTATAFAFLPLSLTALTPIPWLGGLIGLVALLGFVLLYVRAVQIVTGLDRAKSVICALLPGAILGGLLIIAAGMLLGPIIMG